MFNQSFRKIRKYKNSDNKQTSIKLAKQIVDYFKPTGKILEPCKGIGNIYNELPKGSLWCEIKKGRDFFKFNEKVDWIITNPPWILYSEFLEHSYELANNIVFIASFHYIGTKKRFKLMKENNFWLKEILLIETPKEWGGWGFQLVAFYYKRGYKGRTKISYLDEKIKK